MSDMNTAVEHSSKFKALMTAGRTGLVCIVFAAACLLATSAADAQHQDENLYKEFRLGWYHNISGITRLPEMAQAPVSIIVPYHDAELMPFLDRSQRHGISVLPEIPRKMIDEQDYEAIAAYVQQHDHHPAVIGWYSADEPGLKKKVDWSPKVMTAVYNAIRSKSEKPVYLCFSYVEMDRGDVERYQDSFDVMLVNHYPYRLNKLGAESNAKAMEYWKDLIARTSATARRMDRPWLNILQAIGPREGRKNHGFRLPTLEEARFQLFWSVLHDADGALFFCYYWTRNVHASEGEAYDGDGRTWITSIFGPLAQEFKPLAPALLQSHFVKDGVRTSQDQVRARLHRDADGSHLLIILNASAAQQQADVTLGSDTWQGPRIIGDSHAQAWQGSELKVDLKPHEVLVYRVRQ